MLFKLKLCSFVSVPSWFKKEINDFDSLDIEWLVITVLSVDVKYGSTIVMTERNFVFVLWILWKVVLFFQLIIQLLFINNLKPLKTWFDCNYFTESGSCIQLYPWDCWDRLDFMLTFRKGVCIEPVDNNSTTGCPIKKVSIKNFYSELLTT